MKELLSLFGAFARVGAMSFGGGYAMLPMFQRELVENRNWLTEEELADCFAIAQCTPGAIAVNTATFVGTRRAGVLGGIFATLGMVFPSIVIILVVAACLSHFIDIPAVQHAFSGIRVAVCVLILNAVIRLLRSAVVDKKTLVIFLAVCALMLVTNLSPILFVVLAGVTGCALQGLKGGKMS